MRKAISTFAVAFVFVAGASGVAMAAQAHIKPSRCNTKYTPHCQKPSITNKALTPQCVSAGTSYKLPKFTFVSNSGIKKVQVSLVPPKTIKLVTFKGQGPTQYSLTGLKVPTTGLLAGGHHLTVMVTDVAGKTVSKTLHFAICQAKPVFTG